jgi:hypothetical protein
MLSHCDCVRLAAHHGISILVLPAVSNMQTSALLRIRNHSGCMNSMGNTRTSFISIDHKGKQKLMAVSLRVDSQLQNRCTQAGLVTWIMVITGCCRGQVWDVYCMLSIRSVGTNKGYWHECSSGYHDLMDNCQWARDYSNNMVYLQFFQPVMHRTKGGFTASNTVGLVVEYAPATGETRVRFPDGVACLQMKRQTFLSGIFFLQNVDTQLSEALLSFVSLLHRVWAC